METKNNLKRKLLIIGAVVIILFIAFAGVMVKMIVENGKCIDDPFRYAAQRLADSGGNYACSCDSLDPELLDFSFSAEEGIKILRPGESYFNINDLDLSSIEVKGGNEK